MRPSCAGHTPAAIPVPSVVSERSSRSAYERTRAKGRTVPHRPGPGHASSVHGRGRVTWRAWADWVAGSQSPVQ
jgi:hypothetical protein